jgi:hypothetical protein
MEYWEMVTINLSAAGAKEAVARLREFLAANGISLKQTHAYEAIAQTLGYANWNTLQALLNATPSPENEASPAATVPADKQTASTGEVVTEPRAAGKGLGARLSPSLEQSLHRAIGLATERHHEHAALEHLLLSLTEDQDAASVLLAVNVNMEHLRKALTEHIDNKLDHPATTEPVTAKPTTGFQRVIQRAILHVQNSGGGEVTGANVVVALFGEPESHAVKDLQQQGVTKLGVVNQIASSRRKPLDGG